MQNLLCSVTQYKIFPLGCTLTCRGPSFASGPRGERTEVRCVSLPETRSWVYISMVLEPRTGTNANCREGVNSIPCEPYLCEPCGTMDNNISSNDIPMLLSSYQLSQVRSVEQREPVAIYRQGHLYEDRWGEPPPLVHRRNRRVSMVVVRWYMMMWQLPRNQINIPEIIRCGSTHTYWYSVDMKDTPWAVTCALYTPARKWRWICPACSVHMILVAITGKVLVRTKSRYGLQMRERTICWRKGKQEER